MKTLNLFFALLLSLVFSTEIEAQQQGQGNILADITTSVVQHSSTNTVSKDHSPNNKYTVIAVDGYNGDGYAAVYYNTCAGHSFGDPIATYTLPKGTTGAAGVVLYPMSTTISNNENAYFFFKSTIIGNTPRYVLQKNGNEIMHFDGIGMAKMKVFNGYLYAFLGDNGNYWLYKIDENTDQVIFSVPVTNGDIGEMLLMPNGNIAGKVRPGGVAEGNLYEFDANTGAELGLIRSGNPYGKEKFGANGDLEVYDNSDNGGAQYIYVYSQSSGWANIVKRTDLPNPVVNLYQKTPKDWEFKNGEFHALSSNNVLGYMKLSNELVHGFIKPVNFNYNTLKMWFNHDGTYTVVGKDSNGVIHLSLISNLSDDTSLIPGVHIDEDVIDGRNGQIYDNGWQSVDSHILTLVMDDADIPAIGTTPQASWLTVPAGYTYEGAFPIRDDGQGLVYDAQIYKNGYQWYDKQTVRVFIKPASEVVGVQENTLVDFKIWPNPATDYIKFSAEKEISQVEILDRSGRSIMKRENVERSVSVENLAKGTYFVKVISTDGKIGVKKLIIAR